MTASIDMARFRAIFRMIGSEQGERDAAIARLTVILDQSGLTWQDIIVDLPDRVKKTPAINLASGRGVVYGIPKNGAVLNGFLSVVSQRCIGINGILGTIDLIAEDGFCYRFHTEDVAFISDIAQESSNNHAFSVVFSEKDGVTYGKRHLAKSHAACSV